MCSLAKCSCVCDLATPILATHPVAVTSSRVLGRQPLVSRHVAQHAVQGGSIAHGVCAPKLT